MLALEACLILAITVASVLLVRAAYRADNDRDPSSRLLVTLAGGFAVVYTMIASAID